MRWFSPDTFFLTTSPSCPPKLYKTMLYNATKRQKKNCFLVAAFFSFFSRTCLCAAVPAGMYFLFVAMPSGIIFSFVFGGMKFETVSRKVGKTCSNNDIFYGAPAENNI